MVPFKPYFLGQQTPPFRARDQRAEVRAHPRHRRGRQDHPARVVLPDVRQLLLRRLLQGAGDPARLGADDHAGRRGGYGFDPERLWVTVYLDDDEAADIWHDEVGVPRERIQRLGMTDNYWSMGVPGPVRPVLGDQLRPRPRVRRGGRPRGRRRALPRALEPRLHAVRARRRARQGRLPDPRRAAGQEHRHRAWASSGWRRSCRASTTSTRSTPAGPILDRAGELTGQAVRRGPRRRRARCGSWPTTRAPRVMLIGDGVAPGNEGRGYVLRRIIRRTVRAMRLLGAHEPTFGELADVSIRAMEPQYPELRTDCARIRDGVRGGGGLVPADAAAARLSTRSPSTRRHRRGPRRAAGTVRRALSRRRRVQAARHVRLPDRPHPGDGGREGPDGRHRGFPPTLMRAAEGALEGGREEPQGGRRGPGRLPRRSSTRSGRPSSPATTRWPARAACAGCSSTACRSRPPPAGTDVELVLDRTPFYAEGGGQLADEGVVQLGNGALVEVLDVQAPVRGLVVHRARVVDGEVTLGDDGESDRRPGAPARDLAARTPRRTWCTRRSARRSASTATQMGSENSPGRLRFDFPSPTAVPAVGARRRRAAGQRGAARRPARSPRR